MNRNGDIKWESKKIKDFCITFSGGTPNRSLKEYYTDGTVPWIKSGELNKSPIYDTEEKITENALSSSSAKMVRENDLLLALYGATAGVLGVSKIEAAINQAILCIRPDNSCLVDYLKYSLELKMPLIVRKLTQGGQPNLNADIVKSIDILLPEIRLQKRISEILSTWDEAINKCQDILKQLERFKKLSVSRFTQKKFETIQNSESNSKWINLTLKDILHEENDKTIKNNQFDILTSTVDDIFLQSDYFNRQIASKDNKGYKILRRDRLVLSPQNAWMGNVNVNKKYDIGIVSPSYKIYKIIGVDYSYFRYFVKTEVFRLLIDANSQTGASIVRKSLNIDNLLSTEIDFPNFDRQKYLGGFFGEIDSLINKYSRLLKSYEMQKQGLMQQLLTGKIRVNVN